MPGKKGAIHEPRASVYLQRIKAALDPNNILNPGKIIGTGPV